MRDLNSALVSIILSIRGFVSMFVIFVVGFANVFYCLQFYYGVQAKSGPVTIYWYLFYTYDMFHGNWEWGSPPNEEVLWTGNIIFLIFVVLFPIVMFNILIALVVGSFEEHNANLLSDDNKR